MARILIVDDDPGICTMLTGKLKSDGYEAVAVLTLRQGLSMVESDFWDVVLLDVHMPDGNGLELLPDFVNSHSNPEVIIVTGDGALDGAEKAIQGGAWTYIEKPFVIRDLPLHLTRALQYREEKSRTRVAPLFLKRKHIVGESEIMHRCYDDLAKAATCDVNVLISGDTGTGKEIFAQTIHENSSRAKNGFVVVDCASLPESLIESALFGHIKGAFTGAEVATDGLIKHADKGTLFLDEVGELPPTMQKTFLRVLQEHKYRPLGAGKEIHSDFRLLSATNRNLEEMVAQGAFRKDLLYRLKGLSLQLPPLHERKEDIKDLTMFYMTRLCERYDHEIKGLAADFIEALIAYDWPGNVRELFQVLEQVYAKSVNVPTLFSVHLPEPFRIRMAYAGMQVREKEQKKSKNSVVYQNILPWREYKAAAEKDYMTHLMKECDDSVTTACRMSGISRARLYQLLNKYSMLSS